MWAYDYPDRLRDWRDLRLSAKTQPLEIALGHINDWWWNAPIVGPTLQWQHIDEWPDPWHLLEFSGFCDLARALGIAYTVLMIEHHDIADLQLRQADDYNLVEINRGKYILNWTPRSIVNTPSTFSKTVNYAPDYVLSRKIGS